MTRYVVIQKQGNIASQTNSDAYVVIGQADASSVAGAIRQVARTHNASGEYAAIPERSWRFQPVKIEQQTRIRVG